MLSQSVAYNKNEDTTMLSLSVAYNKNDDTTMLFLSVAQNENEDDDAFPLISKKRLDRASLLSLVKILKPAEFDRRHLGLPRTRSQ